MWLGKAASIRYERLTPGLLFEVKPFLPLSVLEDAICVRSICEQKRSAMPHLEIMAKEEGGRGQGAARPAGGGRRKAYGRALRVRGSRGG